MSRFSKKGPAILLFRGRGFISSLIRWQTWGRHSHVAFLLPDGKILEAWQGDGVRIKEVEDWEGIEIYDVEGVSLTEWEKALNLARKQVGKPYDYWGVFRFLWRRKRLDTSKWFCSHLVYWVFHGIGVDLLNPTNIRTFQVSPKLVGLSPLLKRRR